MMHRPHPVDGDRKAIFYDDCPRCDQHAESPVGWDASTARDVIALAFAVEEVEGHYRSANERKACWMIYAAFRAIEKAGADIDIALGRP